MEVLTEVPQTGHKLRIDADRQFDGGPADSTLRIQGHDTQGSQVFDATYVECATEEATVVGWVMRAIRQPPPELTEKIAQEVQAAFGSRLSGRDAHQIAELAWKGIAEMATEKLGLPPHQWERFEQLAERFERAAARSKPSTRTSLAGAGTSSN